VESKIDNFLATLLIPAFIGLVGFTITNFYFNGLSWLYATPAGPIFCLLLVGMICLGLTLSKLHDHVLKMNSNVRRLSKDQSRTIGEDED